MKGYTFIKHLLGTSTAITAGANTEGLSLSLLVSLCSTFCIWMGHAAVLKAAPRNVDLIVQQNQDFSARV